VRVLLDEQFPVDLAAAPKGHSVDTVVHRGWTGITNGELLCRMAMRWSRWTPAILEALHELKPGQLHRVGV
jgi:hypothetical protein